MYQSRTRSDSYKQISRKSLNMKKRVKTKRTEVRQLSPLEMYHAT